MVFCKQSEHNKKTLRLEGFNKQGTKSLKSGHIIIVRNGNIRLAMVMMMPVPGNIMMSVRWRRSIVVI